MTVYPALTTAEEIIASNPDGIMLSNGPGDPKECTSIIEEIQKLYDTDIPIFAICLGHQLMALATGADTLQNEIRTPRRQPSGQGSADRQCIHFLPEPWLCGRYRYTGSVRSSTGICQCKRRNKRRTGLHRKEYFYRTVPPGSMPGTIRIPATCLTAL